MKSFLSLLLLVFTLFVNTAFSSELISYKPDYQTNEPVYLELKNAPHNAEDWIGIYHRDANTDWANVVAWRWVSENSQTDIGPGFWYKFPDNNLANKKNELPLPPGSYVARFFLNNSFTVEDSVFFTISEKIDVPNTSFIPIIINYMLDTSDVVGPPSKPGKLYPPDTTFNAILEELVNRPPEKFSNYQDAAFDNEVTRTVTRLTNREKDQKGGNSHPYPKQGSAWNSDMSLLKLDRRIYDA